MKTIDINAKEWFDKVNGNSYFAGRVTVDFGMETEVSYDMTFQYGYGDQYLWEAYKVLQKNGHIPADDKNPQLWCHYNGVISRTHIDRKCLKRELMQYGRGE